MSFSFPTKDARADLRPHARELGAVWPQFMHHDPVANRFFPRLRDELAHLQFFAWNEELDEVVGEANTVPFWWDGTAESLPDEGLDAALEAAFSERAPAPNALCALQIVIAADYQGRGLSIRMLERMAELARLHGFDSLVAPVRPSLQHRYPLTPTERYIEWRREDGARFDPWLRTHERFGGEIVKVAPRSMTIPGTVSEWGEWAGISFPETGSYVVPGAFVPVEIDVETGRGVYVEPNVWMVHRV